jgi:hypothetical protein
VLSIELPPHIQQAAGDMMIPANLRRIELAFSSNWIICSGALPGRVAWCPIEILLRSFLTPTLVESILKQACHLSKCVVWLHWGHSRYCRPLDHWTLGAWGCLSQTETGILKYFVDFPSTHPDSEYCHSVVG